MNSSTFGKVPIGVQFTTTLHALTMCSFSKSYENSFGPDGFLEQKITSIPKLLKTYATAFDAPPVPNMSARS